jgi:hypothetical protein
MDLSVTVYQAGLAKDVKKILVIVTLTLVLTMLNVLTYFEITFVFVLLALMAKDVKLHLKDVLAIHVNMMEVVVILALVLIVPVRQNILVRDVNMNTILVLMEMHVKMGLLVKILKMTIGVSVLLDLPERTAM